MRAHPRKERLDVAPRVQVQERVERHGHERKASLERVLAHVAVVQRHAAPHAGRLALELAAEVVEHRLRQIHALDLDSGAGHVQRDPAVSDAVFEHWALRVARAAHVVVDVVAALPVRLPVEARVLVVRARAEVSARAEVTDAQALDRHAGRRRRIGEVATRPGFSAWSRVLAARVLAPDDRGGGRFAHQATVLAAQRLVHAPRPSSAMYSATTSEAGRWNRTLPSAISRSEFTAGLFFVFTKEGTPFRSWRSAPLRAPRGRTGFLPSRDSLRR